MKIVIKESYTKTVKSRSEVPDTMLRCRFCGKLNTDLNMTVVESEKSSSGKIYRRAHCKPCAADDRRKRRLNNNSSISIELNEDDFISMKVTPRYWRIDRGLSETDVMNITGHKSRQVFDKFYNVIGAKDIFTAIRNSRVAKTEDRGNVIDIR